MKNLEKENAITLIAVIITIIISLILAGITIIALGGEGGILSKAEKASIEAKKSQYFEEIKVEISEEIMERRIKASEKALISSLDERICKKSWVNLTIKCDEYFDEKINDYENTMLLIETKDNYEIIIEVDNLVPMAKIREEYFEIVKEKCQITYDANLGTGDIQKQVIKQGFNAILLSNNYVRENYSFVGWCKNKEGNSEIYVEGSRLKIEENMTLYAIWQKETAMITFNANGGDGNMKSIEVGKGTSIKLIPNTFARIGYNFSKWTSNSNGTGKSYNNEGIIVINEDIELFAQWTAREITWEECKTDLMTKQKINTTIYDGYGNKIVIPAGFKIALGSYVTEGIVIQDAVGNQFVWVPVGTIYKNTAKTAYEIIELNRYDFGKTGTTRTPKGNAAISVNEYKKFEELTTAVFSSQAIAKNLNAFKSSVNINKGYYIARYEASSSGSTIASQYNKAPYYKLTQMRASSLCQKMYTNSKFESDLTNGYAWDTAIIFIEKFGTNKDYAHANGTETTHINTGLSKDMQCNIYDMASNWRECTTETCTSDTSAPCTYRGGTYSTASWQTAGRGEWSGIEWSIGFRPILYINQ